MKQVLAKNKRRVTLALAGLGLCAAACAGGQPAVAAKPWTPATLRKGMAALPAGDATRGQLVHDRFFCASCHGANGIAPTLNWPHLAGQKATYTAKMLLDYQSGLRHESRRAALMQDVAVMMSPQDIADVAAYYAKLPLPRDEYTPRPGSDGWRQVAAQTEEHPMRVGTLKAASLPATQLVRKGDPARLITPCASCHGVSGQGGNREAPALAGQNPLYFVRTMLDYHSGKRANDGVKAMRFFAERLTRGEIEALANHYADLMPKR